MPAREREPFHINAIDKDGTNSISDMCQSAGMNLKSRDCSLGSLNDIMCQLLLCHFSLTNNY